MLSKKQLLDNLNEILSLNLNDDKLNLRIKNLIFELQNDINEDDELAITDVNEDYENIVEILGFDPSDFEDDPDFLPSGENDADTYNFELNLYHS